jgi:hypothetical protein
MLRKTGASTGMGVSARPGAAEPVVQASRPWAACGSINVDALVIWALVVQRAGDAVAGLYADEARADGYQWQERTGLSQIEQIAKLGRKIDVSGGRRDNVHPAAEAVAAAVRSLDDGGLVTRCAWNGAPNGWAEPARWLVPERWEIPGERAMWCRTGQRNIGMHCPLVLVASPDTIAAARDEYRAWWDALAMLGHVLAGRNLGFAVLPPSVVREPWEALDSRG